MKKEEEEVKMEKPGNAAAMREALVKCELISDLPDIRDYVIVKGMRNIINGALAAPPRNCDVGTAEEQARRYQELCDRHTCGSICSRSGCPCMLMIAVHSHGRRCRMRKET